MFKFLKNLFSRPQRYLHVIDDSISEEMAALRKTYTFGVTESAKAPTNVYEFRELFVSHISKNPYMRDNPDVISM